MTSSPYHPHPGNPTTLTDDSSGWETAAQPSGILIMAERIAPHLHDGTAMYVTGHIAVAVNKARLLASPHPAQDIASAIAWLNVFAATVLPTQAQP